VPTSGKSSLASLRKRARPHPHPRQSLSRSHAQAARGRYTPLVFIERRLREVEGDNRGALLGAASKDEWLRWMCHGSR
jgi:hypothetical protein